MDIITIDIGNTTISVAVFDDGKLEKSTFLPIAEHEKLVDVLKEYREMCGPQEFGASTVPVVGCSVNPKATELVEAALDKALNQRLLLAGRDFALEMKVALSEPEAVGSDRLLCAYAAFEVVNGACLVADFGTATTIDLVSDQGIFLGGVILPGLDLAAKSLNEHTAVLPEVEIQTPTTEFAFGIDTVSAINNGIYHSAVGTLRQMAEQYATYIGTWPQVVVTGGYSKMIAEKCDFIDSLVPELMFYGLNLAYTRYRQSQEEDLSSQLKDANLFEEDDEE
ncbi:MAG: type III pantothenate kinase [Phycisphaerae bacterium]|nr:type III pantothenate kinase [Phycisphaerae bacterium]